MKVAIATDSWPPYPADTSMYRHTRDVLEALRLTGVDAYPLALEINRGARIGGLVRPYLRRHFGSYRTAEGTSLVHHVTQDSRRGVDVVTVHDLSPFHDDRFADRFMRDVFRTAIRRARRVVFTTRASVAEAEQNPEFRPYREKFRVVPVPHRTPPPGVAPDGRFDALWVGRVAPNKNLPLYLSLARALPHRQFALRSSKSPGREHLSREVDGMLASLSNVTSLPRLPDPELDRLYRATPVLVVTSTYEGFHDPAMEAYVRGVNLVLPSIEPFLEIYREASGGVFWYDPAGGVPALTAAFERARNAPLGSPDPRVVNAVSLETVGQKLKALYQELVA